MTPLAQAGTSPGELLGRILIGAVICGVLHLAARFTGRGR